jgi:hypothetical protein
MKHACLLASVFLILVGCSTSQPLHSVDSAVVFTGSGSQPTLEQIRRAIVASVTRKGWTAKNIGSRQIQATLNVRKNIARVVIAYSTRSYSITYKDSHTLAYDGATIHRNYNKWVRKLKILINRQLGSL